MADSTGIEWTDATWNPTVGCSVLSPGCTNCYAMKLAGRLEAMGSPIYRGHTIKTKAGNVWNGKVGASNHGQMIKPMSWKKPRRIFVNSMSDLFHEDMPDEVIAEVFDVMARCQQHTFQILTKRAERMARIMNGPKDHRIWHPKLWHRSVLPNVWLGVSVEDQTRANERIPHLLATPAAVRFLSCEPLLGPVSLRWLGGVDYQSRMKTHGGINEYDGLRMLGWVIAGGESGPRRRPLNLDWMRYLRDQCASSGVAFFGKQWDKVRPLPEDLIVRQFPEALRA